MSRTDWPSPATAEVPTTEPSEEPAETAGAGRTPFVVLATSLAASLATLLWAAHRLRFSLSNIDGISYLSIAKQYAEGNVDSALNAYWSPLISWLVAPPVALGADPVATFHVVLAIGAWVGVALATGLVWRVTRGHLLASLLVVTTLTVFSVGNLYSTTPDLLVSTWTLGFVAVLVAVERHALGTARSRVAAGAAIGAMGTLGYLTKLFLLPAFVVSVALWLVWRVVRTYRESGRRRHVSVLVPALTTTAVAALVTALLAAPWVAALTAKYDQFMIGSSFSVNMSAKFDPEASAGRTGEMVLWAPPNEDAVSFAEDRTPDGTERVIGGEDKDPVQQLRYYVAERLKAFPFYLTKIGTIAPFAVPTMTLLALAFALGFARVRDHRPEAAGLLVWSVYFAGYAAITAESSSGGNSRYYWPLLTVSVVVTGMLVPALWRTLAASAPVARKALVAVLVALVPVAGVWQHGLGRYGPFSIPPPPPGIWHLLETPERSTFQQVAEDVLAPVLPPGSRIVGSNSRGTVRLAYYLEGQAYGRSNQGYDLNSPRFQALLREHEIDAYLQWTPVGQEDPPRPDNLEVLLVTESMLTCDDTNRGGLVPCRVTVIDVSGLR